MRENHDVGLDAAATSAPSETTPAAIRVALLPRSETLGNAPGSTTRTKSVNQVTPRVAYPLSYAAMLALIVWQRGSRADDAIRQGVARVDVADSLAAPA